MDSRWREMMNYANLKVFADDGTLDLLELHFLMGLALKDEVIDEQEKFVLRSIFDRIPPDNVDPKVVERVKAIRVKHDI